MFIYDLIEKKRSAMPLSDEEINYVVDAYVRDEINDAEMSALLMAITVNGMTDDETYCLTKAMQNSGKTYKFDFESVDKHSTGGVGDSTSFIVVPTLAALGVKVTKMSGKSLGFTGGTIDKLKVFEGYDAELDEKQYLSVVKECGCVIISQSNDVAIADKKIYALRDKTATVDSVPLIASSIMSKKLASGANTILLDVKCGKGAFMKDIESARALARLMVKIGKKDGKNIQAAITNMDTPLSQGVGCNLEMYCVIKALQGVNSPLLELSKYLAARLYSMAKDVSYNEAYSLVVNAINSGESLRKFAQMITLCGGNIDAINNPEKLLVSDYVVKIVTHHDGCVSQIDAYKIAKLVNHLKESATTDKQKRRTGVMLNVSLGDKIKNGDVLATVYSSSQIQIPQIDELLDAIVLTNKYEPNYKLVLEAVK